MPRHVTVHCGASPSLDRCRSEPGALTIDHALHEAEEIIGESFHVKQAAGLPGLLELRTQRGTRGGIVADARGDPDIGVVVGSIERVHAKVVVEARGNAGSESLARRGQERAARPQRIGGRGVGVVVRRVEEQVGMPITAEVIGVGAISA